MGTEQETDKVADAMASVGRFALSTFGMLALRFALRLLKSVVFTRLLGPFERGIYSLLTTVADTTVSVGSMGFWLGNTYLLAKRKYDIKRIMGNTLLISILLGVCLAAAGSLVLSARGIVKENHDIVRTYIPFVFLAIPFVLLNELCVELLIATKQIHFTNVLRVLASGLPVICLAILWFLTGATLQSAVYAWVAAVVVVAAMGAYRLLASGASPPSVSLQYLKEGLSYGTKGFLGIVAYVLISRVDVLFVAHYAGAEALGYYAVSVSLAEILMPLGEAFNVPFLPIQFGLEKRDARDFAAMVVRTILFLVACASMPLLVCGKLVIIALFGRQFLPAYLPFALLVPGVLALCVYTPLRTDLYGRNLPGYVSFTSFLTLVVNMTLNLLLIPAYGIKGAAISSSVSYVLMTYFLLRRFLKLTGATYREVFIVRKQDLILLLNVLRSRRP